MKVKTAKYVKFDNENVAINVVLDDDTGGIGHHLGIPVDSNNTDYIEIMGQVDAGEATIEPADEPE